VQNGGFHWFSVFDRYGQAGDFRQSNHTRQCKAAAKVDPMSSLLQTAFALWGASVSWLEVIAFVLALGCVICNVALSHWGWPLAIVSSGLYSWLFSHNRLYGDAALQLFFVLASIWGWWQWLFGKRLVGPGDETLQVCLLSSRQRLLTIAIWLLGWIAIGLLLRTQTDSDVPWADAFPTAGSLIGQVLLGRKFLENWVIWQIVNICSIGLLGYKQLWLSMVLYVIFLAMAIIGFRSWLVAYHASTQIEQKTQASGASR
jgi:nicotinamide mononucleotide transporter